MQGIDDQAWITSQGNIAGFLKYPDMSTLPNYDAQHAKQWAAELIGVPNLQQLAQYSEAPTAEQVSQVVNPAHMIQTYDLENWKRFWDRVFTQVHLLCKQYLFRDEGTDKVQFVNQQSKQAVTVTKQDFEYDYIIASGGDIAGTNPVLQDQKRFGFYQLIMTNKAAAPFVSLYDMIYTLAHRMLPYNEAQSWIPTREAAEKMQQAFLQMQAQAMAKEAQGKRTREPRVRQFRSADTGIMPR